MHEINAKLAAIAAIVLEAEDPITRAQRRMKDAYARGGFHELHHRTRTRIKAMKNPQKLQGMRIALKRALADDMFPLTPNEEKQMMALFGGLADKL